MLDRDLLGELDDRLSRLIPLDDWTNPGLSEDEARDLVAPLGWRLPDEALAWWGWRNGANEAGREKVLPPWRNFVSLREAVAVYEQAQRIARDVAPSHPHEDPFTLWRPEWFPLDDTPGKVVVDCLTEPGAPTPVRLHSFEAMDEENHALIADSLGVVVEGWCHALDVGAWEWDPGAGRWWPHWERLDPGRPRGV
jgi:hypothetical protein